jgi:predicted transcriptional regulator
VTEVAACCSVDMSVVSRHLGMLADAGILESTKTGRNVSYRVRYAELTQSLRALADAFEVCCPEGDCDCGGECSC